MQIDVTGITALTGIDPATAKDKKTAEAARDFEALLIAQMLRSAREMGSSGWIGSGDDGASSPAVEFAEQQLANLMANAGGLGLSATVIQGLSKPPASKAD
jgi:Rod binding domain-containing protein